MYKQISSVFFKIILNKRFLVSKTQGLYCKNPDIGMKVRIKSQDESYNQEFFRAEQVSLNMGTSINA